MCPYQPAQSIEDLEERRLRALVAVATAVAEADDLAGVLEAAAEVTRAALEVSTVSISRWDRDGACVRTLINVGDLAPHEVRWPEDEAYPLASFPALHAVLSFGLPHRTGADDPAADAAERELLAELGKAWSAAVPIVVRGAVWGELFVTRAAGLEAIADADVSFLEVVASQVAIALGRAEALADLRLAAYRDPLTGLANRRGFDERLAAALAGAAEVVVVFADVDGLKTLNDAQGHEAGDDALRAVAATLDAVGDEATLAARIGGDEFGLVLEDRGVAATEALAAEVDRRLAARRAVTLSWGIASTAAQPRTAHALMRAADEAQYAAKRARHATDPLGGAPRTTAPGAPTDAFGRDFARGLGAALRRL